MKKESWALWVKESMDEDLHTLILNLNKENLRRLKGLSWVLESSMKSLENLGVDWGLLVSIGEDFESVSDGTRAKNDGMIEESHL